MATRRIFCTALTLALLAAPAARAENAFFKSKSDAGKPLPVDQAFVFEGAKKKGKNVEISWQVTPGYYLYKHMFKVSVDAPAGLAAPTLTLPDGEKKHDEDFGDVEVFHQPVVARFSLPASGPQPTTLRVKYQGCADIGLCYPPQTRIVAIK